ILLPEIPYDVNKVVKVLRRRNERGSRFSILAVAEGALSKEEAAMSKKEFKAARASMEFPSISYRLAHELSERLSQEIRVVVPGHFQRGGSPCPYDRVLSTRFGTAAAQLIINKNYGNMVALQNGEIVPVPLKEVAGKLKTVPTDCSLIRSARDIGVSFGD
ncbi:MAG TPA: 6-phosphofructokinase, partial [Firmicutes bacterium]|nr:6-phosphofructokinase [Bacillota bacterium]